MKTIQNILQWILKQKGIVKILIAFIGLNFLCCLCSVPISTLSPKSPAISTSVELPTEVLTPTNTPEPTATLEPRVALKSQIEGVLGSSNRNIPTLISLEFNNPEQGAIFINWAINDNLTEDLIVFGAKSDATDILKALAQSGTDYTYVILSGSFPMADKFGNSDEKNVVNLTFNKETVERINWDDFLSDNIYSIANEANVWVAFQDK